MVAGTERLILSVPAKLQYILARHSHLVDYSLHRHQSFRVVIDSAINALRFLFTFPYQSSLFRSLFLPYPFSFLLFAYSEVQDTPIRAVGLAGRYCKRPRAVHVIRRDRVDVSFVQLTAE